MASQSTGIQQLLSAEKRAAEKVSEARKRKAQRLKQAKFEADAEIQAYRQEREKQFKEEESRIMGSKGDAEAKIDQSTKQQIAEINVNVTRSQEKALSMLLGLVYDIKPELHQNIEMKK